MARKYYIGYRLIFEPFKSAGYRVTKAFKNKSKLVNIRKKLKRNYPKMKSKIQLTKGYI